LTGGEVMEQNVNLIHKYPDNIPIEKFEVGIVIFYLINKYHFPLFRVLTKLNNSKIDVCLFDQSNYHTRCDIVQNNRSGLSIKSSCSKIIR